MPARPKHLTSYLLSLPSCHPSKTSDLLILPSAPFLSLSQTSDLPTFPCHLQTTSLSNLIMITSPGLLQQNASMQTRYLLKIYTPTSIIDMRGPLPACDEVAVTDLPLRTPDLPGRDASPDYDHTDTPRALVAEAVP
jgi:hypothetical protein